MGQTDKNRKSEAQEINEQADNAGRFSGNDTDAIAARQQSEENIRQDTNSSREERNHDASQDPIDTIGQRNREMTDAEARRDPAQSHDYKGEAQNVNDDTGRALTNEEELQHARNKANSGNDETRGIP